MLRPLYIVDKSIGLLYKTHDIMKENKTIRILHLLTILQSKQNCSLDDIAAILETSRRTVFRDLKALSELGVPSFYDREKHSYSIKEGIFMPPLNLTAREALALLMVAHRMNNKASFPYKKSLLMAILKIENTLPIRTRKYCNKILKNISIENGPQVQANLSGIIFGQLQQAILKNRKVNIDYSLPREKKTINTDLIPFHMRNIGHKWFVFGRSSYHKSVCTFNLNQINNIVILNEYYINNDFDVSDHLGRAWSMLPEGRLHNVKLRFLPKIAHSVIDVQWHSTQKVDLKEDGSAIVTFRIDGLNEVLLWILSYGDQVEILSPEILRQKIRHIAQKMVDANQQIPCSV